MLLEAAIKEELVCTREKTKVANRYALTLMNEGTIIRQLPRKIAKYVWCSYEEEVPYDGSSIHCTLTGVGNICRKFPL